MAAGISHAGCLEPLSIVMGTLPPDSPGCVMYMGDGGGGEVHCCGAAYTGCTGGGVVAAGATDTLGMLPDGGTTAGAIGGGTGALI